MLRNFIVVSPEFSFLGRTGIFPSLLQRISNQKSTYLQSFFGLALTFAREPLSRFPCTLRRLSARHSSQPRLSPSRESLQSQQAGAPRFPLRRPDQEPPEHASPIRQLPRAISLVRSNSQGSLPSLLRTAHPPPLSFHPKI